MNAPRSLRHNILLRVAPVTLVALTLVLLVTRHRTQATVRGEIDRRLAEQVTMTARLLSDRIYLLRSSIESLADSSLIANSITDEQQSKKQLSNFFSSLQFPSNSFRRATLADASGRPFVSTGVDAPTLPNASLELTRNGDAFFDINRDRILIASPVRASGQTKTVLAVEYDSQIFLDEFQATKAASRFRLMLLDSALYDSLSDDDELAASANWIAKSNRLPGYQNLTAELSEPKRNAVSTLRAIDMFFVGTLATSMIALFLGITAAAKKATQPLTRLVDETSKIRAQEDFTRRVADGDSSEFHRLSESLNGMIESLSKTTVSNVQLQESESRLRTFIESVPNGIVITDNQGKISLVNENFEEMFGYSGAELIGQPIEMLLPEAMQDRHRSDRSDYAKAPRHRAMAELKSLFGIHQSGKKVHVEIGLSPIMLEDGQGVLACIVDVTDRRIQEKQNESMQRETQLILDSIPALVIYKDDQNRILRVNQAAANVMNATPTEIEGRHSSEFFADHEKYFLDDQAVLQSGKPKLSIIESILTPSGETRWASTDKTPIFDDQGNAIGIIAVINDITELKNADALLAASNKELKRSNEELAQFAYVASHDLQEPLRKVTSYCDLIREDYEDLLDDNGRMYMTYVVDGAQRMRTLIQDLLSYSRLDSTSEGPGLVDLNEAVRTATDNLSEAIRESDAKVTADPLPTVAAQPAQCVQLFQNLIGNSIKYHGDERPVIHLSVENQTDSWVVSVNDNGIGIEPQYYEQIFGVFKRLHSNDNYSGTGIGLAICKRIVERFNGKLWLESNPGKGTTFFVEFPKTKSASR